MRRPMTKKVLAAVTASAMMMSVAACGDTTSTSTVASTETPASTETTETSKEEVTSVEEEEVSPYTVLTDENGNVYDLGGVEIIIRDWWSDPDAEPTNEYQETQQEWREWCMETYNFTIKQEAISDWSSAPADFVDYATTGGDEYYAFVVREDAAITSAMASGLMYDLSTLDCLDFTQDKFTRNKLNEQYSKGGATYAMYAGYSEGRTGVYFNKRVLTEAGIDPESIYDMQADGTWTWDKFDELMGICQRDTDNDGVDDIYGLTLNEGNMTTEAIFSNNGSYIGLDEDGNYYYNLESAETLEALEWVVEMYAKYDNHDPEGANWDYYQEEFKSGVVAFLVDDEYCANNGNFLADMEDEIGFVMFPKGPQATDYVNVWSNNPVVIPACYDAEKAWKIAFAWNLYTDQPAGYEDYMDLSDQRAGALDTRAVDETLVMMREKGTVAYHGLIPNLSLGSDFVWGIGWYTTVSESVEAIRDTWKAYVDEANQ